MLTNTKNGVLSTWERARPQVLWQAFDWITLCKRVVVFDRFLDGDVQQTSPAFPARGKVLSNFILTCLLIYDLISSTLR